MKLLRKVGSTSQIFQVFIQDSSSSTGAGLTGLVFNTSGLTAYYHRDTDTTATAMTLVTMTVGTFTSLGFKEIDATHMPGLYQLCPPNAALASGAASVVIYLQGATNMAPLPIEIDLDGQVDVTLWNGTVVATPATAGIPDVNVKNVNNVSAGSVTTINANQGTTQPVNFTGTSSSALVKTDMVDIAGSAVSATTAQLGVNVVNIAGSASAGAAGYVGVDWGQVTNKTTTNALTGTTISTSQVVASVSGAVGSVTGAVGSVTGAVGSVTGAVGSVTGAVGSVTAAVLLPSIPSNWITAAGIASGAFVAAVWDGTISGHTTSGTFGGALNAAGAAGDPWSTTLPGAYAGGTAGNIVGNRIDATVSSRLAASSYTTPPTVAQVATGVWQDTTAGDFTTAGSIGKSLFTSGNAPGASSGLALVGSNVGTASSVTGAVGSVTGNVGGNVTGSVGSVAGSVGSVTGNVGGSVGSVTGNVGGNVVGSTGSVIAAVVLPSIPSNWITAAGIASGAFVVAVWDGTISGHTTSGTFGGALNAAGAAGDPWSTTLPGAYSAGTAGYIVGTNLDAAVSTRLATSGYTAPPSAATVAAAVFTTAMTESYGANGSTVTLAQGVYEIMQGLGDFVISSTTKTVRKRDHSTTAETFTLNSATDPTGIARAS